MRRPALRDKHFLLLSCLLLLATSLLSLIFLMADAREPIGHLRRELEGVDGLRSLRDIRELVPLFLQDAEARRAGSAAANRDFVRRREAVDRALGRLDRLDREVRLGVTEPLFQAQQRWAELKQDDGREQKHQSDLAQALDRLNAEMGDQSGLILDPKIDTYYLVNVVLTLLVDSDGLVARSRPLLTAAAPATLETRIEMANLGVQLKANLEAVDYSFETALASHAGRAEQLKPMIRSYRLRTQELAQLLDARSRGEAGARKPDALLDSAVASSFHLFDATLPVLESLLERRLDVEEGIRSRRLALLASLLSIATGLAAWGLLRGRTTAPEALPNRSLQLAGVRDELPRESVFWENRELKLLVAELTLENRALRQPSTRADSQAS